MNDLDWAIKKRAELNQVGGFDRELVNGAWKRVFEFFKEHLKTL